MADMQAITRTKTVEPFSSITPAPYVDLSAGMQQGISRGLGELQQITDGIMEQSGRQDGMNAGLERDADGNPTMKMLAPIGAYGRAFNAGAEAAYTSNLASDAEKSIEGFKEQYQDKENGTALYAASWKTYKDKTLNAVAPELRGFAEMKLNAVGAAGLNSVSQYQYQRTREMQGKSIVESLNQDQSKIINLALTGGVETPQAKLAMQEWAHKREALVQGRFIDSEMAAAYDKKLNAQVGQAIAIGTFKRQFDADIGKGAQNAGVAARNLAANIDAWMKDPAHAGVMSVEEQKQFFSAVANSSFDLASKTISAAHEKQFWQTVNGHKAWANITSRMDAASEAKDWDKVAQLRIEANSMVTQYPQLADRFFNVSRIGGAALDSLESNHSKMSAYWASIGRSPDDPALNHDVKDLGNILPKKYQGEGGDAALEADLKAGGYAGSASDYKKALLAQGSQADQVQLMNNTFAQVRNGMAQRDSMAKSLAAAQDAANGGGALSREDGEATWKAYNIGGTYDGPSFVKQYGYVPDEVARRSIASRNPEDAQNAYDVLQAIKEAKASVKVDQNNVSFWSDYWPRATGKDPNERMANALKDFKNSSEGYQAVAQPGTKQWADIDTRSFVTKYGTDYLRSGYLLQGNKDKLARYDDNGVKGQNVELAIGHASFNSDFKKAFLFQKEVRKVQDDEVATKNALEDMSKGRDQWGQSTYAKFGGNKPGMLTADYHPSWVKSPYETSKVFSKAGEDGMKVAVFMAAMEHVGGSAANGDVLRDNTGGQAEDDIFGKPPTVVNGRYVLNNRDNLMKIIARGGAISLVADATSIGSGNTKWNITIRHPDGSFDSLGKLSDYDAEQATPFWRDPNDHNQGKLTFEDITILGAKGAFKSGRINPTTRSKLGGDVDSQIDGGK